MKKEIWKDVVGYENLYQVSNLGNVKRTHLLKPNIDRKGYYFVNLSKNGIVKCCRVHQLVARAFISNTTNKLEVNHKDGNKLNNSVDNLEWSTHLENMRHALKNNLLKKDILKENALKLSKITSKQIWQYKNGILIKKYNSCAYATRETGIKHISCCAIGKRKTAGGYEWRYI